MQYAEVTQAGEGLMRICSSLAAACHLGSCLLCLLLVNLHRTCVHITAAILSVSNPEASGMRPQPALSTASNAGVHDIQQSPPEAGRVLAGPSDARQYNHLHIPGCASATSTAAPLMSSFLWAHHSGEAPGYWDDSLSSRGRMLKEDASWPAGRRARSASRQHHISNQTDRAMRQGNAHL
jgi:hypothetical protein